MKNLVSLLKALADENRFQIIMLLLSKNYCVKNLSKKINISESAVSQHLKILRNAGLVKGEKIGYYTHYETNREVLMELSEELSNLSKKKSSSEDDSNCIREEGKPCQKK